MLKTTLKFHKNVDVCGRLKSHDIFFLKSETKTDRPKKPYWANSKKSSGEYISDREGEMMRNTISEIVLK